MVTSPDRSGLTTDYINLDPLRRLGLTVIALDSTDSTNLFLKRAIRERLVDLPALVVAKEQLKGRGTKGRVWIDDPESCLKLSVAYALTTLCESQLPVIGPLLALQLAQKIPNLFVKWPNDLYINGKKVAGILSEVIDHTLIVGIGFNIWSHSCYQEAGCLYENLPAQAQRASVRTTIAKILAEAILTSIRGCALGLSTQAQNVWCQKDLFFKRTVDVIKDGRHVLQGLDLGVDAQGRLLLQTDHGLVTVESGEVSIRSNRT